MSNDGWGKPSGWTIQQAADKAVEILESGSVEIKLTDTVKEVAKSITPEVVADSVNYPIVKAEWPNKGVAVGWDLGKQDITKAFEMVDTGPGGVANITEIKTVLIDQSIEAVQLELVKDPQELEFLLAREVKLNLGSKLFSTDCLKVGDLAIHDDIQDPEYFAISHVPTLTSFMTAVPTEPDKTYENIQLVRWCTKVQQAYKDEWGVLRSLTPTTYKGNGGEAAMTIRDWCLSVEIE